MCPLLKSYRVALITRCSLSGVFVRKLCNLYPTKVSKHSPVVALQHGNEKALYLPLVPKKGKKKKSAETNLRKLK